MIDTFSIDQYSPMRAGIQQSANILVPWLMGVFQPKSVLDVGCGEGWWLSKFKQEGIKNVCGLDLYDDSIATGITKEERIKTDLIKPWDLKKRYDLTLCLEVAEHLPATEADNLVQQLAKFTKTTIIFSAAIPGQSGYGHVNEQWPEYWLSHFSKLNYIPHDTIRRLFWNDNRIEFWYRQNTFILCPAYFYHPKLYYNNILPMVHPDLWCNLLKIPYENTK